MASRGLVHTNGVCPKDIGTSRVEISKFGNIEDFGVNDNPLIRGTGSARNGVRNQYLLHHFLYYAVIKQILLAALKATFMNT